MIAILMEFETPPPELSLSPSFSLPLTPGFFLGNPATTFYSAIGAGLDTYWGHQMISKPLYDSFVSECRNAPHFNVSTCAVL